MNESMYLNFLQFISDGISMIFSVVNNFLMSATVMGRIKRIRIKKEEEEGEEEEDSWDSCVQ